jgi:AcrR family transcriptional regulator
MKQTEINDSPKDRILNEAEILFAEKGFHAVTVREITRSAKCNLAAVNYHFGNKENLYLEVFKQRWIPRAKRVRAAFQKTVSADNGQEIAEIVHALAHAFLKGPLTDDERLRHAQLMIREMAMPTLARDRLIEEVIQPFFGEVAGRLRPLMGEAFEKEGLMLNIISVFSMVIYFNFARVPVRRVTGEEYDEKFKEKLVDHIVKFSVAGFGMNGEEKV